MESRGTVLYDAACGVCSRWVSFFGPTLRRHGFDIAPLQSPGLAEKLGMSEDELLHDVRLPTPSRRERRNRCPDRTPRELIDRPLRPTYRAALLSEEPPRPQRDTPD